MRGGSSDLATIEAERHARALGALTRRRSYFPADDHTFRHRHIFRHRHTFQHPRKATDVMRTPGVWAKEFSPPHWLGRAAESVVTGGSM